MRICARAQGRAGALPAKADGTTPRRQIAASGSRRLIPRFVSSSPWPAFRLNRVKYEITPEPTPEELRALLDGLERLLAGEGARQPAPYRSAWRLEGLRENVEDE